MTTWAWRSDYGDGTYLASGCGFQTEKKAIEAAIASEEDDEYWVCPCEDPKLSQYFSLGDAIEAAEIFADEEDDVPEGSEWPELTREAVEEFNQLLDEWATKHGLHPDFDICGVEHRVELDVTKKGK